MKKVLTILAVLTSVTCIFGGVIVILSAFDVIGEDFIWVGIGVYFIGKGIFVGPMLISNIKD